MPLDELVARNGTAYNARTDWTAPFMDTKTSLRDDYTILTLHGEFDGSFSPELQEKIEVLLEGETRFVILNMRLVSFISSTALGAIIKSSQLCEAHDGELIIAAPSPFVSDVLDTLGIDRIVPVFGDEDAAKKHVVQQLNAVELSSAAPVRVEKMLITFRDDDRKRQLGHRHGLLATMIRVNSERIQFVVDGSRQGIRGDQARQLLPEGSEIHLDFHVKLIKKGFFDVVARIEGVECADDDHFHVNARFTKIEPSEQTALAQFVEDMVIFKRQRHED